MNSYNNKNHNNNINNNYNKTNSTYSGFDLIAISQVVVIVIPRKNKGWSSIKNNNKKGCCNKNKTTIKDEILIDQIKSPS